MHQCWTFWLAWRSSQTLHSDCSSELKQISRICWERRLESKLVEHLCSWNTGTVKCVCLYLHSAHHLHSTQNKSVGESQRPSTWMTGPATTVIGLALGKPVLSPMKLQNNQCIFISLCKPRRTEIKTAGRNKATKLVFDLKTTGGLPGNYPPKLPFMGRQGGQKSNGLLASEGGEFSALQVMSSRC